MITIHNAENWLGLDEEGGGMGGPCDNALLSGPPTISPVSKTNDAKLSSAKLGRSDSPDSAVDVHSASADSPSSSTTSDFHADVTPSTNVGFGTSNVGFGTSNNVGFGTANSILAKSNMSMEDQDKVTTSTQTGIEEADLVHFIFYSEML